MPTYCGLYTTIALFLAVADGLRGTTRTPFLGIPPSCMENSAPVVRRHSASRARLSARRASSGLSREERADLVRSLRDLRHPVEMAIRSLQSPAFHRCPGTCNLLDRILNDWLVKDKIVGRVEHQRRHLDLRGIDRCELGSFAEVQEMIGIRDGSACSRRLIEEPFDLEFVREYCRGVLAVLCRRGSESLPRPLPAVGLKDDNLERCFEALGWRLLIVVVALVGLPRFRGEVRTWD